MREILFRGKDKEEETWVEGSYFLFKALDLENLYEHNILLSNGTNFEVYKETLGEYVGRKDNNGVKIFEDDILETEDYIGWVCYNEENTCFSLKYYDMHNEVYEVSLSGLETAIVTGKQIGRAHV